MAVLRMKEIRDMTMEQRLNRLEDLRNEIMKQKIKIRKSGLTSGIKIREIKRAIARILTVIKEEELEKSRKQKKTKK